MGSERPAHPSDQAAIDAYGANYGQFASALYSEIRREAFDEDIGQQSWLTAAEHDLFIHWLELGHGSRVLDVGCGAGGPTVRLARLTGCSVTGIDAHPQGIASARALEQRENVSSRVHFAEVDASQALPFPERSFDAVICIDAINHLPDRERTLAEWARVLVPGGRLLFTDPTVVTGPVSSAEIATRSSLGYYLFLPPGENERLLHSLGLEMLVREGATETMETSAQRRADARAARAQALQEIEGAETYAGQQAFLRVTALLAREHRLSRFVYLATKPA